jgi:hypothetical protein
VFGFFKSGKPDSPSVPADQGVPETAALAEAPKPSWAQRLKQGLARTRTAFTGQIAGLFGAGAKIDEALFEDLETVLLTADVGVDATQHLIQRLRDRVKRDKLTEAEQLKVRPQRGTRRPARAPGKGPGYHHGQAFRHHAGGHQRCRQDHHHRQAGTPLQGRGARA